MAAVAVVILCHGDDQVEQLEALPQEAFSGASLVVVVLSQGRVPVVQFPAMVIRPTHRVTGFNAGANRDEGLARALGVLPGASVVFLDGDCRPSPGWLAHHAEVLAGDVPTVTCGSRWERCRPDARLGPVEWEGRTWPSTIIPGVNAEIEDRDDVDGHRTTWSCSLGINQAALVRIRSEGNRLWGSDRIFPPFFDGAWGGEDTGLGVVAWESGCRIIMLDPDRSHVEHEPHRSRATRRNLDLTPTFIQAVRNGDPGRIFLTTGGPG